MKTWLLMLTAGALSLPAYAQTLPVSLSNVSTLPSGQIKYVLTNTDTQPITAWAIRLRERASDGQAVDVVAATDKHIVDSRRGIDADDRLNENWLMPQIPRDFTFGGQHSTTPQLTAVAIVLADGTAYGDDSIIAEIFRSRALARDTRRDILAKLREVQSQVHGVQALREAQSRLSTPVGNSEADNITKTIQSELSELAQRVADKQLNGDVAMEHVVQQVEREYRANAKHAVLRKGR